MSGNLPTWDETTEVKPSLPTWDQTQEVSSEAAPISKGESFLKGAEQGASFGFADELAGGLGSVLEMLPGSSASQDEDLRAQGFQLPESANYTNIRDEARQEYDAAQKAHPGYNLAGNIIGGMVTAPAAGLTAVKGGTQLAKIGNAAIQSGKAGALVGLGSSNADNALDMAKDTGKGAVIGAGTGGLVQGVVGGTQALGREIGKKFSSTTRAYDKGLQGINTGSAEFADETSKKANKIVTDIAKTLEKTKAENHRLNESAVKVVDESIDDVTKGIREEIKVSQELQKGINQGRKAKLELQKNDLVKNVQEKFGQAKGQIGKTYDEIERQIPDNTLFDTTDVVFNLQKDLEVNGMLPGQAEAIAKKFSENVKIDQLNFNELRNLRNRIAPYLDSADPIIKKSATNMYKNLNNIRAETLASNPETELLAKTLSETDKRYAAVLDMENSFLGKVNYDKQSGKVFTDRLLKENIPNKEAVGTVEALFGSKNQKLSDNEELLKKLNLISPELKEGLESQFDDIVAQGRNIESFKPAGPNFDEAAAQNPELAKLLKLKADLSQPTPIRTQTDRLLATPLADEKAIPDYLRNNLKNIENPTADTGKLDIQDLLGTYKNLTKQDLSGEVSEVVKDIDLVKQAASEKPIIVGNPINTIQRMGQQIANMTGRTVKPVKDIINTTKNVTQDDIGNIMQNLQMHGSPEASVYASQLAEAANKGQDSRNAVLFGLMQQAPFRAIMRENQSRKREEK